ncbi:MAG: CopD family protein [Gammaproteobacteria bacterium]|nr:CopD family protein [Gammaproteobacteria bacterium]
MEGLITFLDSLFAGIKIVLYAMTVGGLFWLAFVLVPVTSNAHAIRNQWSQSSLSLIAKSALGLGAIIGLGFIMKFLQLQSSLDDEMIAEFFFTEYSMANIVQCISSIGLGVYLSVRCQRVTVSPVLIAKMLVFIVPVVVSGAWLVHGASRCDNAFQLMSLTVIHQLAAAAWFGSVLQLLVLYYHFHNQNDWRRLWKVLLKRFSRIGIPSVVVLVTSGTLMAIDYVGSFKGLAGTGYGNLLIVKLILLVLVLILAGLNFTAAHRTVYADQSGLIDKVVYFIEAEALVLIAVLLAAVSLSSLPPAIDIPHQTAGMDEILQAFEPKIPRLLSPTHDAFLASKSSQAIANGRLSPSAATAWSEYNHHFSGIVLIVTSLVGMLYYFRYWRWTTYWPFGLMLLSVFLFFRSDAETWPLGPGGFWDSVFSNIEVLQHRIATVLAFVLGVIEFRVRAGKQSGRLKYLFPLLCMFGGVMLFMHSHVGFQPKSEFLIQISHIAIGVLAIVMACSRLLEIRLSGAVSRATGFISVLALSLIALLLMVYREPLI